MNVIKAYKQIKSFLNVPYSLISSSSSTAYIHILFYQSRASVNVSHFSYQLAFFFFFVCIGQYNDDNRTTQQIYQQQYEIEGDDENGTSAMFQANYQYTPLKEYAAVARDGHTVNDNTTYGYQSKQTKLFFFINSVEEKKLVFRNL
jgi:hypothetical protein